MAMFPIFMSSKTDVLDLEKRKHIFRKQFLKRFKNKYGESVLDFTYKGINWLISDYNAGLLKWTNAEQVADYLNFQRGVDIFDEEFDWFSSEIFNIDGDVINVKDSWFYFWSPEKSIDDLLNNVEIYDIDDYISYMRIFESMKGWPFPTIIHKVDSEYSMKIAENFFKDNEDWYIYFRNPITNI